MNSKSGILLIDKPQGITSAAVVGKIKRAFKLKKIGHGGTLDPLATGLLPVCINEATKISSYLFESDKVYSGVMRLGVETDTQDISGKVMKECDASHIQKEQIETQLSQMLGDIEQLPPMYSALKKHGKPLYHYARKNEQIERQKRPIHIYSFSLLNYQKNEVYFQVHCSKGTYVRTLCHDIGASLGVGGTLASLKRLQTGKFNVNQAITLEALSLDSLFQPPHWQNLAEIFKTFPSAQADESLSKRVRQGHWPLFREFESPAKLILAKKACLLDDKDQPLALMEPLHQRQVFKLVRVFN